MSDSPPQDVYFTNDKPHHLSFQIDQKIATCLSLFHDRIFVSGDSGKIHVLSLETGELQSTFQGHEGGVWGMCHYGENTLLTSSTDKTIRIWDILTGRCTHILEGHTSTVRCIVVSDVEGGAGSPKMPLIVSGSRDHSLRVWTMPPTVEGSSQVDGEHPETEGSPYIRHVLLGHEQPVRALDAKGRITVSGSYDNTVRVWDILTGECKFVFSGHTQKVYAVALDLANHQVFSTGMDATIRRWNLQSGECLGVSDEHSSLVGLMSLSGQYLVSGAADATVRVWDRATGALIHTLAGDRGGAITALYHDDHKVVSGSDTVLQVWDIREGRLVKNLLDHSRESPGFWRVVCQEQWCIAARASTSGDTTIDIWDFSRSG